MLNWDVNKNINQQWKLVHKDDNTEQPFKLKCNCSEKFLEPKGNSAGVAIHMWDNLEKKDAGKDSVDEQ